MGFVWFCERVGESREELCFSSLEQLMLRVYKSYKLVEDSCIVEVIG